MDAIESSYQYDVALSYAGEERDYVLEVALGLRSAGVRVFFDEFMKVDLWGQDLYSFFDDIFRKRARYAVLFVSKHYVTKPWPRYEGQSAFARALTAVDPYMLPVRMDDSDLPGLRPTIGYINARTTAPRQLVQLLIAKLGVRPSAAAVVTPVMGVPHTPVEIRELLGGRPRAWEYLLFAGILVQGKAALESKWHDHVLRYSRPLGNVMSDLEALTFLESAMDDIHTYTENVMRVLSPTAQEAAFGPKGGPGDPERIEHVGRRLITAYEDLLEWSARIRGAKRTAIFDRAFKLIEAFGDDPIREIRDFIDRFVDEMERVPGLLEKSDRARTRIELTLTIRADQDLAQQVMKELRHVRQLVVGV